MVLFAKNIQAYLHSVPVTPDLAPSYQQILNKALTLILVAIYFTRICESHFKNLLP